MFGNLSFVLGNDACVGDVVVGSGNIFSLLTFGIACAIFTLLLVDIFKR
jgi:hypothetical protein